MNMALYFFAFYKPALLIHNFWLYFASYSSQCDWHPFLLCSHPFLLRCYLFLVLFILLSVNLTNPGAYRILLILVKQHYCNNLEPGLGTARSLTYYFSHKTNRWLHVRSKHKLPSCQSVRAAVCPARVGQPSNVCTLHTRVFQVINCV